ncbi:glyoxalase domain-containing protein 4-like [Anopheles albimanus]|uniref:glyoxalase domain-containing protein 4-like n=1 Tax=Anopheles albimanus TaxID=7167 RepID=UPI00163F62DD|nr:glyoxalase domain-containing protein 4-like [Anopheles albimanus]
MNSARALHYVLKIGNRQKNIEFFRDILNMKVLRHEEFTEGCDAACNGPYDNRWSKTMIGYGPEDGHFVLELTYNYGVSDYVLGNDLAAITVKSSEAAARARKSNYPFTEKGGQLALCSPDGYKFIIGSDETPGTEEVIERVALHVSDLNCSLAFWADKLQMVKLPTTDPGVGELTYDQRKFILELRKLEEPLDRAKAYGRIAFAVPYDVQPQIDQLMSGVDGAILKPLITLDTPGKASVRVIILADPDGHEICFVDEEGFSALSVVDPSSDDALKRYIQKDPFQK